MTSSRITFKMVLLGEATVGKTAIRERYLGRGFKGKYTMTLGADFALKRIPIKDTMYITQIWDLAGQSGFTKTRKMYYGGAMAGLLVFDINNPVSFEKLDIWINEIQDNIGELIPLVLIGNKSDLRGKFDDQVSSQKAKSFALQLSKQIGYRVPYIETSALDGSNIDIAFEALIRNVANIIAGNAQRFDPDNIDLSVDIYPSDSQDREDRASDNVELQEDQVSNNEVNEDKGPEDQIQTSDHWNIPQIKKQVKPLPIEETEMQMEDNQNSEDDQVYRQNLFPTKVKNKRERKNKSFHRSRRFRR